jgi:hypothetical protein
MYFQFDIELQISQILVTILMIHLVMNNDPYQSIRALQMQKLNVNQSKSFPVILEAMFFTQKTSLTKARISNTDLKI